ncbi:MAG: DUF1926 domain-containing protein [Planctomycetota bacterium]|nr:MAG: DUF1926 domain-containing protein [Planctomycetota bacterium]
MSATFLEPRTSHGPVKHPNSVGGQNRQTPGDMRPRSTRALGGVRRRNRIPADREVPHPMSRPARNGNRLKLALVIHNHQPIGNFDFVVRQACEDSYRPFLDLFERHAPLRMSLHISGSLLEWLLAHAADYVDRVRRLIDSGRIEVLGGPQYEPILAGIPRRDRIGQIRRYTRRLADVFGTRIRGMWTPERVWEPCFTGDLAQAGIEYTILDDHHFLSTGVPAEELFGHFLTEDQGHTLRVFPGNERLRYLIPFRSVGRTIRFLRRIARRHPGATVVFGDDGEKFGTWPGTKQHVYQRGWLRRFFRALQDNADWLQTVRLCDVVDTEPPAGRVQLPECSYREMTEWALPPELQLEQKRLAAALRDSPLAGRLPQLLRGASWRNFRRRYDEANEMYCRMMLVSQRLHAAARGLQVDLRQAPPLPDELDAARDHLYQAQCNCPYWHGAFGGLYLPFLRSAVYHHLIRAEECLDRWYRGLRGQADRCSVPPCGDLSAVEHSPARRSATSRPAAPETVAGAAADTASLPSFGAVQGDFDADGREEIRLRTPALDLFLVPHRGGQLTELDLIPLAYNVLATMDRRPEAYHEEVRMACRRLRREEAVPRNPKAAERATEANPQRADARHDDGDAQAGRESALPRTTGRAGVSASSEAPGAAERSASRSGAGVASIHEAVRLKRPDLDRWLVYDRWRRKGLVDHFLTPDATARDLQRGRRTLGGFATAPYRVLAVTEDARRGVLRVRLRAAGPVADAMVGVTKRLELRIDRPERIDVTYTLDGLPAEPEFAFAVEFHIAGLAADADDRYFLCRDRKLGRLHAVTSTSDERSLSVVDEWLGLRLNFVARPACTWWTFPICTVNGSESGYELVQQSAAVVARWPLQPDGRGRCRFHWSLRCDAERGT